MGATDYHSDGVLNIKYTQQEASPNLSAALELPPLESLPPHIQNFINDISELPVYDQAMLIHQFTLSNVDFISQDQSTDTLMSFEQVLAAGVGDCNDIAIFEAALLQYAGVDPQDIGINSGVVKYVTDGQDFNILHSFILLDDDGQFLILDANNPQGVAVYEYGNAIMSMPNENGDLVEVTFYLLSADQITLPNGQVYMSNYPSQESIDANAANEALDNSSRTITISSSEFFPS